MEKIISEMKAYFDVKIIGSYVFVEKGLLDIEDINDIDVIVEEKKAKGLYAYLENKGYKQTIKRGKQIGYENHQAIWEKIYMGDFKKENAMSIDVMVSNSDVWSIYKIISLKLERGTKNDIEQIAKIVDRMKLGNE